MHLDRMPQLALRGLDAAAVELVDGVGLVHGQRHYDGGVRRASKRRILGDLTAKAVPRPRPANRHARTFMPPGCRDQE